MEGLAIVIFGISSDLAKKKIIPALHNLISGCKINELFLIGCARSDYDIQKIIDESLKDVTVRDESAVKKLKKNAVYVKLDFENKEEYSKIKEQLKVVEDKKVKNRLFYLATLPEHFIAITEGLVKQGLVVNDSKRLNRVLYEKPFGNDLKSAREIDKVVDNLIGEEEVYRVDHYLGKKSVYQIRKFRFENAEFEDRWNNKFIEEVQITLNEDFGIGGRGAYYDKYGVIKDVIQNHALQILSLVAMEKPASQSDENFREEIAKVLKESKVVDAILGQYLGYKSEKNVSENSETETFCALKLEINNSRWKGVNFFIKAGKNLENNKKRAYVRFKDNSSVVIEISPESGFFFEKEGERKKVFGDSHEKKEVEGYELIIREATEGKKRFFVRNDEIENAWKLVDSIDRSKVYEYGVESKGPKEFEEWSKRQGITWKN